MSAAPTTIPRAGLVLLALLSLGWGLNWPIMKTVITEIPRLTFRGMCLVLASGGLFAIARVSGAAWRIPDGHARQVLVLAASNIAGWNVLSIYGISHLASGRAAILGYTMPLWSMLLSAWLLGDRLTPRRLLGLALGMGGMGLLASAEFRHLGEAPLGVLFMLAAAMTWAGGVVAYKRSPPPMSITSLTAWQMLIGGVPIWAAGLAFESVAWDQVGFWPLFGLWYNVFVAVLFCYWAWNRIVQMVPVGVSSLGSLIVPVVGVFGGMVFLGEQPRWQDFAALLLVLGALGTVILPAGGPK